MFYLFFRSSVFITNGAGGMKKNVKHAVVRKIISKFALYII